MRAMLKYIGDGHFKYYEVIAENVSPTESKFTIRYGRIGGAAQETVTTIPIETAESKFESTVASKTKKGYQITEWEGDDGSTLYTPHPRENQPAGTVVQAPPEDVSGLQDLLTSQLAGLPK